MIRKIEPTKLKIRSSQGGGIFHDSRKDVNTLAEALKIIVSKQNEMIETINRLIDSQENIAGR